MSAFLAAILERLVTSLISRLMEYWDKKKSEENRIKSTDVEIDRRVLKVKDAYKEAFDGTPVTKEQRAKVNEALREFIRGGSNGGL